MEKLNIGNVIAIAALFILLGLMELSISYGQNSDLPWYLNDPRSPQAAAASINASKLVQTHSSANVIVAVLDNGVDPNHPSLAGKLLPGVDMVSPKSNPRGMRSNQFGPDTAETICPISGQKNEGDLYHGTKVASVIAGNGKLGVKGVSEVKILPIKVVGTCKGRREDLIDAIAWAAGFAVDDLPINPTPAKVINISMAGGGTVCNDALQNIVNKVIAKNIIIVGAAGNTFGKPAQEPSVCTGVISVGALNPDTSSTFYSALDSRIMVGSPGGGSENKTLGFKNKIRVASYELNALGTSSQPAGLDIGIGTSFAAPLTSAVIAGLALENPKINTNQVIERITALPLQTGGGNFHLLNYEGMRN